MDKVIMLSGIKVTCDHCDFEEKVDHIRKYHNKTCPKCKHADILVTDKDLVAFEIVASMAEIIPEEEFKEKLKDPQLSQVDIKVTDGQAVDIQKGQKL